MKRKILIPIAGICLLALAVFGAYRVDMERMAKEEPAITVRRRKRRRAKRTGKSRPPETDSAALPRSICPCSTTFGKRTAA